MKSLTTLQKTFQVFQILAKVAMILPFVWAGLTVVGLLCGIIWQAGGTLIGARKETLFSLTKTEGLYQMIGALLSDLVFALTDGVLMLFASQYFKQEQIDGTPFTKAGATQIRRLGIRTIVLPLVAAIVSAVLYEVFGLSPADAAEWSNLTGISMGITLILASLVFHYGAELESASR